ncbi:MAG: GNAT family N-acetyltransferase [Elusimicrobia bacterium]|nr:GNAT family N-acetyltransferase [Elusimicrobiota bacterium]
MSHLGDDTFHIANTPALQERALVEGLSFRLGGFHFTVATTEDLLEKVYGLRYQSYVKDYRFAPEADFPDGRHTDRYDPGSIHAVALDSEGNAVGTVRLVLNSPLGFQCLGAASEEHQVKLASSKKVAELSRLALANPYAGAFADVWSALLSMPVPLPVPPGKPSAPRRDRRRGAVILLGLFRMLYRVSKRLRLTGWCFMCNPATAAVYVRHGVPMNQLGPVVDRVGNRASHLARFHEIEHHLLNFDRIRAVALDLMVRDRPPL